MRVRGERRRGRRRWLEWMLLCVGGLLLGYCGWVQLDTYLYQRLERWTLDRMFADTPVVQDGRLDRVLFERPRAGDAFGRIDIPALRISSVIVAGTDFRSLQRGVGLIAGTALPGERGNTGLAAHRDTFFRALKSIRVDDLVVITTRSGTFHYAVQGTRIVDPDDVWVLDATSSAAVTLVTCYPFSYVGRAPQRFVVRAVLRP
jgi:sortase A